MARRRQRAGLGPGGTPLGTLVTGSLLALALAGLAVGLRLATAESRLDGPGQRVFDHFLGAVSPDRRFLTFTDWSTGDLAVRDLESGAVRRLTHKGTWELPEFAQAVQVVSPDGRHVAYGWQGAASCDLRVVELAGSAPRILHQDDDIAHLLPKDWSRNGEQILAALAKKDGTDQVVTVSVADGSVRVLKTFSGDAGSRAGHMMAFSPDGRFVVFDVRSAADSAARDLHLLAVDGSGGAPLVEHAANDYLLGWPAGGDAVLFASDRSGTLDVWALRVVDGEPLGVSRRVWAEIPPTEWAMLSRDGALFYARVVWENDVYLTTLDPETGLASKLEKLIDHVGFSTSAEWSPDGRFLAYALGHGRHAHPFVLGIRSLETGQDARFELDMERLGGHAFDPHWSPDGKMLLGSGRRGIYAIDPQTGEVSPMVGSPGGCPGSGDCIEWPVWASADRTVFTRFDGQLVPRQIVLRDLQSGVEEELYRVSAPLALSQLAASRDGQQLAFVQVDADSGVSSLRILSTTPGGQCPRARCPGGSRAPDTWLRRAPWKHPAAGLEPGRARPVLRHPRSQRR